MKKVIAIIAVMLFAFAITSVSFAVGAKKVESAKPAEVVKVVSGTIKAVDTVAQTLTVVQKVKGKAKETTVTMDDKTSIMMGKQKKSLEDLKSGEKVAIKYTEVEGKNIAKSVTITPVKKKAKRTKK